MLRRHHAQVRANMCAFAGARLLVMMMLRPARSVIS